MQISGLRRFPAGFAPVLPTVLTAGFSPLTPVQPPLWQRRPVMRIPLAICAVLLGLSAQIATAETLECQADLAGQPTALLFESDAVGFRSIWEKWSPLAPECPSEAILLALKPEIVLEGDSAFAAYCLLTDPETGAYLAVVKDSADRFGRCKTEGRVCRVFRGAKEFAGAAVSGSYDVLTAPATIRTVGIAALTPTIGGGTVLAATVSQLGAVASSAVTLATAPAVATGAVAGAVVIGGAVLVCGR